MTGRKEPEELQGMARLQGQGGQMWKSHLVSQGHPLMGVTYR